MNEKVEFKGVLIRDVQDAMDAYRAARARAEAAEAKLREAVEVMRDVCEAWEWWNVDTYDRCSSVPNDAVRSARAFLATMEKPQEDSTSE